MKQLKQIIDVHTGEVSVAAGDVVLRSTGIGSCITVAAVDFEKPVGGMAHIMLPGTAPQNAEKKSNYASNAISQLFDEMHAAGADRGAIAACLVGAGNVLKKPDDTICDANIESVTHILKEYNTPIKATVLGGVQRKSVTLDTAKGIISYTEGDGQEDVLWKAEKKEPAPL